MEQFAVIDNYLCIKMPQEVDHHGAAGFMDSSGIGIIIGRYRKISCFGGKVYAIHADERIRRILKASGMSSIIEVLA